jgi:hypothetical protein
MSFSLMSQWITCERIPVREAWNRDFECHNLVMFHARREVCSLLWVQKILLGRHQLLASVYILALLFFYLIRKLLFKNIIDKGQSIHVNYVSPANTLKAKNIKSFVVKWKTNIKRLSWLVLLHTLEHRIIYQIKCIVSQPSWGLWLLPLHASTVRHDIV